MLAGVGLRLDGGSSTLNWTGTAADYPSIIALDPRTAQLEVQNLELLCNKQAGGVIAAFNFTDVSFTDVHVHGVAKGLAQHIVTVALSRSATVALCGARWHLLSKTFNKKHIILFFASCSRMVPLLVKICLGLRAGVINLLVL